MTYIFERTLKLLNIPFYVVILVLYFLTCKSYKILLQTILIILIESIVTYENRVLTCLESRYENHYFDSLNKRDKTISKTLADFVQRRTDRSSCQRTNIIEGVRFCTVISRLNFAHRLPTIRAW